MLLMLALLLLLPLQLLLPHGMHAPNLLLIMDLLRSLTARVTSIVKMLRIG